MLKRDLEAGGGSGEREGRANPLKRVGRPGLEGAETPQSGRGEERGGSPGLGRTWHTPGLDGQQAPKSSP